MTLHLTDTAEIRLQIKEVATGISDTDSILPRGILNDLDAVKLLQFFI